MVDPSHPPVPVSPSSQRALSRASADMAGALDSCALATAVDCSTSLRCPSASVESLNSPISPTAWCDYTELPSQPSSISPQTSASDSPSAAPSLSRMDTRAAAALSQPSAAQPVSSSSYLRLLLRLRKQWQDCPSVTITYSDLSCRVRQRVTDPHPRSFLGPVARAISSTLSKALDSARPRDREPSSPPQDEMLALAPCSGVLSPRRMTLILAPSGHGKTTFLKAIAGRLQGNGQLRGSVRYNGSTSAELRSRGVVLSKLVAYTGQTDRHFPALTVAETVEFAARNSCASTRVFGDAALDEMEDRRARHVMALLGLEEVADSILGNDLIRGVSGGQRRRVTLAEQLVSNARMHCLDEVTTGLDSATAFRLFRFLRQFCDLCEGGVVAALLQPSAEVFALFDDLILLREGRVVFQGERKEVRQWLHHAYDLQIAEGQDECAAIADFLREPRRGMAAEAKFVQIEAGSRANADSAGRDVECKPSMRCATADTPSAAAETGTQQASASLTPAAAAAISADDMARAYRASRHHSDAIQRMEAAQHAFSDPKLRLHADHWSAFSRPHSSFRHLRLAVARQSRLLRGSRSLLLVRFGQSVVIGFVTGSLFYQLSLADYASKMGLLMFVTMYSAFANLSELPVAAEARAVVTKQLDSGMYPAMPYVVSVVLLGLPSLLLECLAFGTLMYWLPGFTASASQFFFFLLILFCSSLACSTFFRSISFATVNSDVARQLDFPFILLFIIFGGVLLPYSQVPRWLIFVYWLNPLSWAVRSLAVNEFTSSRYSQPELGTQLSEGQFYLEQYDVQWSDGYQWWGALYLLGFFLVFALFSGLILQRARPRKTEGARRTRAASPLAPQPATKLPTDEASPGACEPRIAAPPQLDARALSINLLTIPFEPVTVCWSKLDYSIEVSSSSGKETRRLLSGCSGFCAPSTLTAVMGESGAGKTTLMDIIADRKTTGETSGVVLVNGRPRDAPTFRRLHGYVEQQDLHMGLLTVRESVDFSARLRLPASVSDAERCVWVDAALLMVELSELADHVVGDADNAGLSPGQLKLLTIAVELVANPAALFLDEPTTGLDSPSALSIVRVLKRLAATGRTVLCTIHQPSAELFFLFDRLVLLQAGGREVYVGDVGPNGQTVKEYLQSVAGSADSVMDRGGNLASWMMDRIDGRCPSSTQSNPDSPKGGAVDWNASWMASPQGQAVETEISRLSDASSSPALSSSTASAAVYIGRWQRYVLVQQRYFVMHWRNGPANLTRVVLMLSIGLLLGLIFMDSGVGSFQSVSSLLSVLYMGISFPASISSASVFPSFFRQRAVYYRESAAGMYGWLAYSCGMTVVELVYIALMLPVFLLPFYWLVGLQADAALFFRFYLVLFVQTVLYSFFSQLWMAACPTAALSITVNVLVVSLFFLFGGLFIKPAAVPRGWKWFYWLDPLPKTYIAASLPQLHCEGSACPSITVGGAQGSATTVTVYEYVCTLLESSASDYWPMIGWLLLTLAIVRIVNLLVLRSVCHLKR